MINDELLITTSYIKISTYRLKVMKTLNKTNVMTPTEIAKSCGIRVNHISTVLKELKEHELIECINEEMRKGRLYRLLTELGKTIMGSV